MCVLGVLITGTDQDQIRSPLHSVLRLMKYWIEVYCITRHHCMSEESSVLMLCPQVLINLFNDSSAFLRSSQTSPKWIQSTVNIFSTVICRQLMEETLILDLQICSLLLFPISSCSSRAVRSIYTSVYISLANSYKSVSVACEIAFIVSVL